MTAPFEQWVWVETEPDGKDGMIVAMHPALGGMIPLAHRKREVAEYHFRPIAEQHGERTGNPVRLVRMIEIKS